MTALRWTALDSWTMARRAFLHWRRQPGPIAIALLFPVLMVVMFGYLLGGQMEVPAGEDYFDFLLPGMLVLGTVFGLEATMMAVTTDASRGVTDRLRSLPMSAAAILLGRGIADVALSAAGIVVVAVAGIAVGWSWDTGAGDVLAAVGLLLLLRLALVWVGIHLGLLAGSPEAVVAVQILVWPFAFLSNAFVSPDSMPGVLGAIAECNPMSATVTAVRERFGNPGWETGSWASEHAELLAVAWPLILLAVFVPLAVRRYRSLGD